MFILYKQVEKAIIVLLLSVFLMNANAEVSDLYSVGERRSLLKAMDLVEGRVLDQSIAKQRSSTSCFSYLYRLEVEKSYKGKFKKGDVVNVGLNLNSIKVEAGKKHLIILNDMPDNYFQFCDKGDAGSYSDIKITYGYMVGLVEITKNGNGDESYRGVSCSKHKPVMYEENLGSKKTLTESCYQVTGPYSELVRMISFDLGEVGVLNKSIKH